MGGECTCTSSHSKKNSNNQRKLKCLATDFYHENVHVQLRANTPAVESVPF